MTSKLTIEQARRLRNDFECWQQDYDPKDDKEQYDMFGRGIVAMDMLIAGMHQEPVAYAVSNDFWNQGNHKQHIDGKQCDLFFPDDVSHGERFEPDDYDYVFPLYRHAQPVPVVSADLLHTAASAIEDLLTIKDRTGACVWFDLPFRLRSAANAQPAPVVPDDVLDALQKVARIRLDMNDFDGDRRGIAECLGDAEEALIEVVNRRAAMLQELQKSAGAEVICRSNENVQALNTIKATPALGSLPKTDEVQNTNSPVIPDGYVMVPVEPNGDMLAAAQDAYGETDGDIANTLRAAMLAAAPQSPGSEPTTVPGKWIPVSERMPERGDYLVTDGCDFDVQLFNGERFIPGFVWEDKITHWMPLPAAPQEGK